MAKRGRKAKAYWQDEVECPCCHAVLDVTVNRKRTNVAVQPEFEFDTVVTVSKQANLFPPPKAPGQTVEEKPKKTK